MDTVANIAGTGPTVRMPADELRLGDMRADAAERPERPTGRAARNGRGAYRAELPVGTVPDPFGTHDSALGAAGRPGPIEAARGLAAVRESASGSNPDPTPANVRQEAIA